MLIGSGTVPLDLPATFALPAHLFLQFFSPLTLTFFLSPSPRLTDRKSGECVSEIELCVQNKILNDPIVAP